MNISLTYIGIIRTPFTDIEGMPIQSTGAAGIKGRVEVNPEYAEGLCDLDGFSHLILLYHFHKNSGYKLKVKPFLDGSERGLFATRAPCRPNPIGISVVKQIGIDANVIHVTGADVLDGTPLFDIKPYVPVFDSVPEAKTGWLSSRQEETGATRSDGRFRGGS